MATDLPVWFITGCSTGFGREMATLLLNRGDVRVVATARKPESLDDLVKLAPDRALAVALDVDDRQSIESAVASAEKKFGRVDVLVNNAGYGYLSSIEEGEDDKIRSQFETNVFGLIALTQRVLPGMRERRRGNIVNVSSIGGLISFPATGFYHGTKFAVEGLSESLAQEVGPLGIKVTIVEPGPFRTDWAGRSIIKTEPKSPDYAETVGKRQQATAQRSGNQPGDPVRGSQAIIDAVESKDPPLRLLLGKFAYEAAIKRCDEQRKQFEQWKDASLSADYPNPGANGPK